MPETILVFLFGFGILSIIIGIFLNRIFFQRQTIAISEPEITPPITLMTAVPQIKHTLSFKVPRRIKTHESGEVTVEYFQGVTYWVIESLNNFLYEKLDLIPTALPRELRGLLSFTGDARVKSYLESDLGARLSSSKISISPPDWISFKRESIVPCRWRWSISCNELGTFALVFEADDELRDKIPVKELSSPIIFQIKVLNTIGLSLHSVTIIKYGTYCFGLILSTVAALLIAIPDFQQIVWNFIKTLFS